MRFRSPFSIPLIFLVLYSCRPTAAAALAVSPVKRGLIECPGPLPPGWTPSGDTEIPNLLVMCAIRMGNPQNLGCTCYGKELTCGVSRHPIMQVLINYCYRHCVCGPDTKIETNKFTGEINYDPIKISAVLPSTTTSASTCDLHKGQQRSCCSKTCTANRDCDWFFTGDCKCYAPPAGLFYWFSSLCGSVHHFPKRDLAQQRRSFYLNATARFASTAAPPPRSDLAAQLASGLLPSPCNASYVSFACGDSPDGIVHEPPQNWLGALLPEGAKASPPVPKEFIRIHGGEEGKLQVVVE